MKRLFLFSGIVFCTLAVAQAQVQVGLRIAPSVSALRLQSKEDTKKQPTYALIGAGMFLEVGQPNLIRFFAEAEYQPRRISYNIDKPVQGDFFKVQYLTLGPGIRLYTPDIFVGSRLMMEMAARTHLRIYQDFFQDPNPNVDKLRHLNLSLRWGAGLRMDWRESVSFFGMIGYERGLSNVLSWKETHPNTSQNPRLDVFSLSVGIVF